MTKPFWEELLGNIGKHVRGAVLLRRDGHLLRSTLPINMALISNAGHLADLVALAARLNPATQRGPLEQIFIKGDFGYILVAPLDKQRILAVVIDLPQYDHFNINLKELFADDHPTNDDPRLPDPILPNEPPQRGAEHAEPEFEEE